VRNPNNRLSPRPRLTEKLLLLLSRKPEADNYEASKDHWSVETALRQFCACFPGFLARTAGNEILDFGCGTGYQAVALAQMGAKRVVGLDVNAYYLNKACQLAQDAGVADKVEFRDRFDDSFRGRFDVVTSQNSMEHFYDPVGALNQMKQALKKDGVIFLTFGPPWFAPFGSHQQFFVRIPWINILFEEKTVMAVRRRFNNDGATRYEEAGLNKMTVKKFETLIRDSELRMESRRYDCVKRLNLLGKLPLIRELAVNQISCVLTR